MIVIFRQTIQDAERQSQGVDAANVTANTVKMSGPPDSDLL